MFFRSLLLVAMLLFCCSTRAQFGAMPPFTVTMEAIAGTNIPGLHSFAFAKSGDKWLIIGGRTNGLHGLNSNDGFPPEFKNDQVIVIDTSTWSFYAADLNQLSWTVADPLRSTNMQYAHDGDYLYMTGGFGYDSLADIYVTFPVLSAIHVDNMIDAVINAQPIAAHIRQISDPEFAVCGGEMAKLGSDFYLGFGHNFGGRYTDPPTPMFTQEYHEKVKKFSISDDGTTITVGPMTTTTDTNNFHRRDMNLSPVILPDDSQGLRAYGGVFKKDANLPYLEPITINAGGITVSSYQQQMSQYTCALMPAYDSTSEKMYSTFFGGISLHSYNEGTSTLMTDSLMPFINDVTTMVVNADGTAEETILPLQLNGLIGSNAKFVLNDNIAHYSNEVIHLNALPESKVLAGYFFGGIRAQSGNFGSSAANDTVYRIYISPNLSTGSIVNDENMQAMLYPNPASSTSDLLLDQRSAGRINIVITDISGKELRKVYEGEASSGKSRFVINCAQLSPGLYFVRIRTVEGEKALRLSIAR
jgi:hypothetical protein